MFNKIDIPKTTFSIMLLVISFYTTQTFYSIKTLEKDVVTIRIKLAEFEAKRMSREEICTLIKEYHDSHSDIK